MLNFEQQLSSITRLLKLGEHTIAANECVKLIEQALRHIVLQHQSSLDDETIKKLEKAIQKRDTRKEGVKGLTMGQLVYVMQESKFFDALSRTSGNDLNNFFRILDLHKLTQLRNKLTHEAHEKEASSTEAQWLFNSLKLLLETFGLVNPVSEPETALVPETPPSPSTTEPEAKEQTKQTEPQEPQSSTTHTTSNGSVTGQVHTGSGAIHVQNFSVGASGSSKEAFFAALQELRQKIEEARSKGLSEDIDDDAGIELDAAQKEAHKAQPKSERIIKRLNTVRSLLQESAFNSLIPDVDRTIETARNLF